MEHISHKWWSYLGAAVVKKKLMLKYYFVLHLLDKTPVLGIVLYRTLLGEILLYDQNPNIIY